MNKDQLTLSEALTLFSTKIFTFSGRATRAEFWLTAAFIGIIIEIAGMVCSFQINNLSVTGIQIMLLIILLCLIIMIPITTRRLHDINRRGWYQLLYLVPIVGWLILFFLYIKVSDSDNKYGEKKDDDYQLKFSEARRLWWQKKFTFSGRATRAEFWLGKIWISICVSLSILSLYFTGIFLTIIIAINQKYLPSYFDLIGAVVGVGIILILIIGLIILSISLIVRRLHDIGKSGWWILLFIVLPGVLNIVATIIYVLFWQINFFLSFSKLYYFIIICCTALDIVLTLWYIKPSDDDNKYGKKFIVDKSK
ncbi:DUF805 domain-containing protein [Pectinatus sottacetonis]|uniref:DUF805 domain-containing protein n=1 Tax=Pectinatus sottacetonis TaxID=1002795 RepID=UPI0018C72CA5|nr:DUF805 domain-containing protein [Pectinatus sottacetonis]